MIFHCHLSQQRGPKAAGQYAQARQAAIDSGKLPKEAEPSTQPQQVLVLRGGFSEFQDKYKVSRNSNKRDLRDRLLTSTCIALYRKTQLWSKNMMLPPGSSATRLQLVVGSRASMHCNEEESPSVYAARSEIASPSSLRSIRLTLLL